MSFGRGRNRQKPRRDYSPPLSQGVQFYRPPSPPSPPSIEVEPKQDPKVDLDPVQMKVFTEACPSWPNLMVTGAAGTGKSVVAREIIRRQKAAGRRVRITASTGIAAINVGGCTIHSFLGTNVCGSIADCEKDPFSLNSRAKFRIRSCDTIMIDEVSMLSGDYVDMIDWRLRQVTEKDEPFGGKQMIFFGDFLQLPPVNKDRNVQHEFAFEADAWKTGNVQTRVLTVNHRQGDDAEFSKHLARVRVGKFPKSTEQFFEQCVRRRIKKPIILYPTNAAVDQVNREKLAELPGKTRQYGAEFSGYPDACERLARDCIAESDLRLKTGAQVLMVMNVYSDHGSADFMNGERGTVLDLEDDKIHIHLDTEGMERDIVAERQMWSMKDADGHVIAAMRQFPTKLGYAITIHKSQSMTLERMRCDLSKCFAPGQTYVALSRARNAKHLSLDTPLTSAKVYADGRCVSFYESGRPKARRIN